MNYEPLRCGRCGRTIAEHDRLMHCNPEEARLYQFRVLLAAFRWARSTESAATIQEEIEAMAFPKKE